MLMHVTRFKVIFYSTLVGKLTKTAAIAVKTPPMNMFAAMRSESNK